MGMNLEDTQAWKCKLAKKAELYALTMDYGNDKIITICKLTCVRAIPHSQKNVLKEIKWNKLHWKLVKDAYLYYN